ncbi:dihydrofolate reductase family protein [Streptosporangium sandarakinum]|uniref:dihydrofolate reductase family protein n=1 Tax=Streptosporangium sandarakinum TaxID=1260955 RepID=UPI0037195796
MTARKIAAGLFVSLDGVVEAPEMWHFPYLSEEMGAAVGQMYAEADTLLLGRGHLRPARPVPQRPDRTARRPGRHGLQRRRSPPAGRPG